MSYLLLIVFVFSLLLGSFLNVCIYRIPRDESIVYPGSHCTSCGAGLKAVDLVPVFSYFLLKGKCRYCKSPISVRYILVEVITAALITAQVWRWGLTTLFLLNSLLTATLIIVSMIDLDHQIIPDRLVVIIAVLALANLGLVEGYSGGLGPRIILDRVVGFLLGGGLFLLIAILSKGGMGGGDVKLVAVLGLWFGWPRLLVMLFIAFVVGAIVSLALLFSGLKERKDGVPFGPFLAGAAYFVSLYGTELIRYYLRLF